jgi:GNAT superfamily N-acetyltransferase
MAVTEVRRRRDVRRFIDVAWRINERDPMWVPPLRSAVRKLLDRRGHPFHEHADVAFFLAERDGRPVGRVAAVVNHRHNEFHEERTGFFGLFECEDRADTARALLDTAADWLRERGMERVRGPMNLSTNDELSSPGVLVSGFDTPPMVMMSHNPPYYESLVESAGFLPVRDLVAYWMEGLQAPERFARVSERLARREGASVRSLDITRFDDEVDAIKGIYNSAWARNWGFVPMTDAEFDHMARELKPVVDPHLCMIVEVRGEPVGFSLALPDLNQALVRVRDGRLFPFGLIRLLLARRHIRHMRVLTLGFKPGYQNLGLGGLLYLRTWQTGVDRGYRGGEASWILEDNEEMRKPVESIGARLYRRYRVFEKPL